ncbi:hypothetical protein [Flavobacterium sp. GT3R68]|uniref:hypothetical protein n=1 Tax=Flavobacterium sp. GT3R68 TaxID=2594437 RepID=UPI000F87F6AA|nr:hypothetical protein [Flavobacterium sp. GT3R68]RTY95190.1 hypothetical protein EKL32_07100 [Flavobacterium sp. GSN2]TRW91067.1 hypothetical protein FNW07_09565 [Flavobacterium sp. GT3R68]
MKTKFICSLLTAFILTSCSNDRANQENLDNNLSASNSSLQRVDEEDALEAPFRSCYYKSLDADTYIVFFEIPVNYHYTVSEFEGVYFIKLTAANTNNHAHYVTRMEKFTAIKGIINVTFKVNGVIIKKPKVVINTY